MTSDLPEIRDMRASDAERERVAERLRDAVAEGRLDMEEFGERLDAAYKARTHGELEPLVRDLPAPAPDLVPAPDRPTAPGAVPVGGDAPWAQRIGRPASSRGGFAFWGGFGRKGTWTVGRRFTAVAVMAGGEIDLREASFEDRETVIRCITVMGGIEVTVPPDLHVDVQGFGFMGGFAENHRSATAEIAPDSPRVIVTGFALLGGVGVERKLRKADKLRLKEARRRARLEKREQRRTERREARGSLE
ncbi:DUF1707 domain-containing protein [Streptomyces sp. NPDC127084]|uniref:DUF1707 SHOCT-like domain-containing protein n=1 Tax=Streptomyces sp. NPDC127084 TaxID=3347133 RepID=UPI003663FE9E